MVLAAPLLPDEDEPGVPGAVAAPLGVPLSVVVPSAPPVSEFPVPLPAGGDPDEEDGEDEDCCAYERPDARPRTSTATAVFLRLSISTSAADVNSVKFLLWATLFIYDHPAADKFAGYDAVNTGWRCNARG
jgi:hypothetical protein